MPARDVTTSKLPRLRELLRGKRSLLIVMQDNPDPDSIASAAALRRLANSLEAVQCSIGYGGVIGRTENQALADYLGLNFRPWGQIDPAKFELVALVDTQPNTGNNSLPAERPPDIVLDHHPLRPETKDVPFSDVRPRYGAVSTVLYEYLAEAAIVPDPPLATALFYAIRTDTQDLGPQAAQADVQAAGELFPLANTRMLSMIQRNQVPRGYFAALYRALDNARVYGARVVTGLDEIEQPDLTGEVADMLLRLEGATWVLCHGFHGGQGWVSLRATGADLHAGRLMEHIVAGLGTGGGHAASAGAQLPLDGADRTRQHAVVRKLRERFLNRTGGRGRGQRLVPRR